MNKDVAILVMSVLLAVSLTSNVFLAKGNTVGNAPAPAPVAAPSGGCGGGARAAAPAGDVVPSKFDKGMISYAAAMKNGKPSLVLFYVDWCGYCKRFAPYIPQLKKQYGNKMNVVMVNCEDAKNADLVKEYGINGYPSVFMVNPKTNAREHLNNGRFAAYETLAEDVDKFLNAQ